MGAIDRQAIDRIEFAHNRNQTLGTVRAVFGYEARATAYYYERSKSMLASFVPIVSYILFASDLHFNRRPLQRVLNKPS